MTRFTNLLPLFVRGLVLMSLLSTANTVIARKQIFPSATAALAAIFPNKNTSVLEQERGDVNGDSLNDLAILVRVEAENEESQNRLVVLSGMPDGKYSIMSVSSKYCPAQKFYNLWIKDTSLYVSEVHSTNADNIVTNALQFRFNKKLADFELIGRENQWGLDQDGSSSGHSVNYITGKATSYMRVKERTKSQKTTSFKVLPLIRLNGFDCDKDLANKP